jgi:hypothetical protein
VVRTELAQNPVHWRDLLLNSAILLPKGSHVPSTYMSMKSAGAIHVNLNLNCKAHFRFCKIQHETLHPVQQMQIVALSLSVFKFNPKSL